MRLCELRRLTAGRVIVMGMVARPGVAGIGNTADRIPFGEVLEPCSEARGLPDSGPTEPARSVNCGAMPTRGSCTRLRRDA
jgi:hypothetical protein